MSCSSEVLTNIMANLRDLEFDLKLCKEQYEAEIKDLKTKHTTELNDLKTKHTNEINELKKKINRLEGQIEDLKINSKKDIDDLRKEFKNENKNMQKEINDLYKERKINVDLNNVILSLSDIFQNKNKSITDMFKKLVMNKTYKENKINKVNTLNKIINSYKDWKEYKNIEDDQLLNNVKQFIEIILPNISKWNLNLDIYSCLQNINVKRNTKSHKSISEIKKILGDLSKEKLVELNIDDELPNYLDELKKLI